MPPLLARPLRQTTRELTSPRGIVASRLYYLALARQSSGWSDLFISMGVVRLSRPSATILLSLTVQHGSVGFGCSNDCRLANVAKRWWLSVLTVVAASSGHDAYSRFIRMGGGVLSAKGDEPTFDEVGVPVVTGQGQLGRNLKGMRKSGGR